MTDQRKKLDDLLKMPGLQSGADWKQQQAERPKPKPRPARSIPTPEESPEEEGGIRGKLDRLGFMGGSRWSHGGGGEDTRRIESGEFDIDRIIPGEPVEREGVSFWLSRTDYPLDHTQGRVPLGNLLSSSAQHIAMSANDPELDAFDPRKTCFIDTETIGLAGGTGTVAFLIGVGYFEDDFFRLDQCFMRDYDEEEPMMAWLAELLPRFETFVGYNSKSFDLPLMRTRFVQNRVRFPLGSAAHYDLVHAARRVWKRRLNNCSLQNIEREVLGIIRTGDVPSYLIPQFWFDYVQTRDARPLEGIFYHHKMDILSLVSLAAYLSDRLGEVDGQGFEHAEDQLSVIRMHYQQKRYDEVLRLGAAFLGTQPTPGLERDCLEMIGFAQKRRELWEDMETTFEQLLERFPSDLTARLELAKHHEHRRRNIVRAAALCREALHDRALAEHPAILVGKHELQKRLTRLEKKLGKHGNDLEDWEQ
jgi:hypothetical protein